MSEDTKKAGYSETLNLPKTDFPIRAQFSIADAAMIDRWEKEKLSEKTFICNQGSIKFILHDGPPYSNGHIHLGHAYNKISKDIVTKFERMSGKHVPVIPGWDCHGLPIELKVTQEHKNLSREELKKACREYANNWIDIQREEFKKLGVMMRWDKPYITMSFEYEAKILQAFAKFVEQGFIQKKLKTVPWCASCQTVLANAEIEYAERKDPSVYVGFPFEKEVSKKIFPEAQGKEVSMLIWTTTPWTLPLNRSVVVHPTATYALVEINDKLLIVGKHLVEKLALTFGGVATKVLKTFSSDMIIRQKVQHPFVSGLLVPIISDDFVSLEDGTACVHNAPGCGPEDYEIALKNNLEIYSPISSGGTYTSEILPKELIDMPVADGQIWVIKKLAELNRLVFKQSIRHQYPQCWRCRNGLIFRATSQWFCDLSQHNLKNRAMEAIQNLQMTPETGKNRFSATLEGRLEWCLSRQRTWGVPIPALACTACGHVFTSPKLIEVAAQGVAKEGIEFWDRVNVEDLGSYTCESCTKTEFAKEFDIVDVWFESGVSHFAVLYDNPDQAYPADMYLEGKDQHRAWFQSSLLTSLVIEKNACMKEILTHGFTVDEQGKKMSKSLGNVVTPTQIIEKIGTDGLRLWVASSDYDSDPIVSDLLLNNIAEVYRKVRNTCRFLLSNLYDFDIKKDALDPSDMMAIDQYALIRLHQFNMSMQQSYRDRKTTAAFHELADYCTKELSALYLDIIKDRLYVERSDSKLRRSAQTVCYHILHTLTTVMAPILSLTAEQVFDHYKSADQDSIHLQKFANTQTLFDSIMNKQSKPELLHGWKVLSDIRGLILKSLEKLREQGVIKHSLDSRLQICMTSEFAEYKVLKYFFDALSEQGVAEFFKEYCIVSQVAVQDKPDSSMQEILPGFSLGVDKALGSKCQRCWQWSIEISSNGLCGRCSAILT